MLCYITFIIASIRLFRKMRNIKLSRRPVSIRLIVHRDEFDAKNGIVGVSYSAWTSISTVFGSLVSELLGLNESLRQFQGFVERALVENKNSPVPFGARELLG